METADRATAYAELATKAVTRLSACEDLPDELRQKVGEFEYRLAQIDKSSSSGDSSKDIAADVIACFERVASLRAKAVLVERGHDPKHDEDLTKLDEAYATEREKLCAYDSELEKLCGDLEHEFEELEAELDE